MNRARYSEVVLVVAMLATAEAVATTRCHIHPPGSTPDEPVGLIGPFASVGECERERALRFGAAGRCHCAADFAPNWMPLDPDPLPSGEPRLLM